MSIVFKVSLRDHIHRFSLPIQDLTIEKLDETLLKVFEKKHVVHFSKKYQDPEGDLITLKTDYDLQEALKLAIASNEVSPIIKLSLAIPERLKRRCMERRHGEHRHGEQRHCEKTETAPETQPESEQVQEEKKDPLDIRSPNDLVELLKKMYMTASQQLENQGDQDVHQITTQFFDNLFGGGRRRFFRRNCDGEHRSRFHRHHRHHNHREEENASTDIAVLKTRFVSDITLPDATEVRPDISITKSWRLVNDGVHSWPSGCSLTYVGGDKLSAEDSVILERVVEPNETVDLHFGIKTPSKPGRYISHYRMASPEGILFGQRIYVDIIVSAEAETETEPEDYDQDLEDEVKIEDVIPLNQPTKVTVESPPEDESVYEEELKVLKGMGFENRMVNLALLETHNGNLNAVIEEILSWK